MADTNSNEKSCRCKNKAEPPEEPVVETPSCCQVRKPAPVVESCGSCCEVRPAVENAAGFRALYERAEPLLILLSGLALAASFFHLGHGVVPIDWAWIAIVLCGAERFYDAARSLIVRRRLSVDVLISTAIIATIVADRLFPVAEGGHGHSYLFAGGEVAFIMALGHLLEEWTVSRARAGIENLVRLTPQTARRMDGEIETEIPAAEVVQGDRLRVLPGETIPVDGEIESGNTSIDQSLITGESLPVDKSEGDAVYGGTINRFGAFTMRATRVGEDSSLARMIRLVGEAEQKKAPMERIADRWASYIVPAALLTAVLVGVVSYSLLGNFEDSLRRAVTILVVFCPCSLVLATPTAVIAAIGNASHHGILIRSGEALEQLGSVDVVAFDKTGTLTHGTPRLTTVQSVDSQYDENGVLALAASVETLSEHPLAACIVEAAAERGLETSSTSDFRLYRGEGIAARLAGLAEDERVLVGNQRLLERHGLELSEAEKRRADERFELGETVTWVAVHGDGEAAPAGRIVGCLSLADTIRDSSRQAIEQLHAEKVGLVLLTGDNVRAAESIARQAGIDRVEAELLPEGKVDALAKWRRDGQKTCMVGDGLNDAPALKTADVGIAMGKVGSDLAVDAADIVLVGDDISRIPFLVRLARKTKKTILGNIALSMSINAVAVVLASSGLMGPVVGALVHNAGSVFVVLNASLLLRVRR